MLYQARSSTDLALRIAAAGRATILLQGMTLALFHVSHHSQHHDLPVTTHALFMAFPLRYLPTLPKHRNLLIKFSRRLASGPSKVARQLYCTTLKDKSGYYEPRARASSGVILTRGRTWNNWFEFSQYKCLSWLSRVCYGLRWSDDRLAHASFGVALSAPFTSVLMTFL